MTLFDFLAVALLGLAGSGHCLGMCGAFALAAGGGPGGLGALAARHCSYHLGKATAYVFLGVLLVLATSLAAEAAPAAGLQTVLGWLVGAAMVGLGLLQVTGWRLGPRWERFWRGGGVCGALAAAARTPTLGRSLFIGWINGFLPCGLSLAALAYLARSGAVLDVVVGAYVFGLATAPALFLLAAAGNRIRLGTRVWLRRAAGVLLIALGALTMVRGTSTVHDWAHRWLVPAAADPAPGAHHHGHDAPAP